MSYELIIRPEAEADFREAFLWYDEQLPGLGESFLSELDRELAGILVHPERHGRIRRDIRRALLRKFPYGVFYVVKPGRIVVLALLHTSRDPRLLGRRVAGRP